MQERIKEAKRFAKEMSTNDRLIFCRPWPYIVSIRGDQLRKLVHLCKKDSRGKLEEKPTSMTIEEKLPNGKTKKTYKRSIGYLLPIDEVVNDPHLYDKDSIGPIAFTHLPITVTGTKPATGDKVTYYLPEKMYQRLFRKVPASKGKTKTSETAEEFVKNFNEVSLTAQSDRLMLKHCGVCVELFNPWARVVENGNIRINSKEPGAIEGGYLTIKKDALLTFRTSGEAISPVGDAHIRGTLAFNEVGQREPHYQWFGLRPIQKLLDNVKIWPEKH